MMITIMKRINKIGTIMAIILKIENDPDPCC